MEINKISLKKIYITAISFLSIISFGVGINVNAAGSSTLLPISRGGTNANTAGEAATNILGSNFANYSGVLPVAKGGTGATNTSSAQTNLQSELTIKYDINEIKEKYVKICSGSAAASSQGD
ncbi:MAG: hypothetical protein LBT85_01370, partial [Bifidobacteriaceae bacterium]|nr:hypothetical protein [Bifidobacteriaceae bacterium]